MSTPRLSLPRRVSAVSAAAAAVVALTACQPDQIGTAASAGGDRLTVNELQDEVTRAVELRNEAIETHELALPPLDPGVDVADVQRTVLSRWILGHVFDQVATDLQIEVSEADVDDFLDQFATQFPEGDVTPLLAEQSFTETTLRNEVRMALISDELTTAAGGPESAQQALEQAVEELDVEINPRYGSWDETGFVPSSGSVSEPFDQVDPEALLDGGQPGQ